MDFFIAMLIGAYYVALAVYVALVVATYNIWRVAKLIDTGKWDKEDMAIAAVLSLVFLPISLPASVLVLVHVYKGK